MKFLLTAFLCFLCVVKAEDRPNIVMIFIDDMGWSDFSCFGNSDAQTKNIDTLAAEGICFEQFYVNSPICSPSRVAISTGQYPQRWKINSYLARREVNKKRGMANWLDPKAPMLARSLKQAGYATGHFGKWHMGGQRNVGDAPLITEYGFDESLTNFEGLGPRLLPLVRTPQKPQFRKIWQDSEKLGRGEIFWTDRAKITDEFTKASIKFIQKAQADNKPFYINLWPDDVHSPFYPTLEGWHRGADKRSLYLSVLEEMDSQFAQLFDFIKADPKLKNNTLILICSDNGPEKDAGQAANLKGYKTHLYEGGIRSSLIAWGPGILAEDKQGTRNKQSVFFAIDIVPSILKLAGVNSQENYDGEDMADTLIGHSMASRKAPIYYDRPPDRKSYYGFQNLPDLAMRDGDWKLLCNYDGSNPQLYNITNDAGEQNNLSDDHPELTQKMIARLKAWKSTLPQIRIKKEVQ
ncbi:sulfatase-like hydrolase/transferase [Lentisphaera marina]|uniref:sulfatase-like hydrolase/transferase n=1 Tax=Lentisphaera marina TaxID=1111041 RepID=UPI002365D09B|nr:sulfatase-like hydrolase/transferase [Lentisphaera marina]MDD7985240.1 sulfatase-like hydrolase/transferase [Lentisphaera marina]